MRQLTLRLKNIISYPKPMIPQVGSAVRRLPSRFTSNKSQVLEKQYLLGGELFHRTCTATVLVARIIDSSGRTSDQKYGQPDYCV